MEFSLAAGKWIGKVIISKDMNLQLGPQRQQLLKHTHASKNKTKYLAVAKQSCWPIEALECLTYYLGTESQCWQIRGSRTMSHMYTHG